MKDTHCKLLQIEIRIPSEHFDKQALLDDTKDTIPDESKATAREGQPVYAWSYGSRDNPGKQHAHIIVDLRGKKNARLTLTYHGGEDERLVEDVRPPYMEDCASWLALFLCVEEVEANIQALYSFGSDYELVVGLPFPLVVPTKELSGATVTGLSVNLPAGASMEHAMIDKRGADILVVGLTRTKLRLKEFDLAAQLSKLSISVTTLVRAKETGEEE